MNKSKSNQLRTLQLFFTLLLLLIISGCQSNGEEGSINLPQAKPESESPSTVQESLPESNEGIKEPSNQEKPK